MFRPSISSRSRPAGGRAAGSRTLAVLLLLALVFTSVVAGVNAQGVREVARPQATGPQASQPSSSQQFVPQPNKVIQPDGSKPGIYYIDYGTTAWPPSSYPVSGAIRFISWSLLNPADGVYNWAEIDNWIADRKSKGLGTGIMISTYDGSDNGDIKATPDFVIKQPNAVLPATYKTSANDTNDANQPHYNNYWKRAAANGSFEHATHTYNWTLSGDVSMVTFPPAPADTEADGYAAMLGGANNSTGYIYHSSERIPAMPAGISPAKTVYVTARIGMVTTDPNPNDHLYIEVWDAGHTKLLNVTPVDINNLSQTSGTWKTYEFDISSVAPEKSVSVQFRVANDGNEPTSFYVDNVSLNVRHLIPNYWPDTDAQRTFYKAYKKFIMALGAKYKDNPDFQFVALGTGVYGENQPTQSDFYPNNHFDHVVEKYGNLTGTDWMDFVKQITLDHATAFSAGDGSGKPARNILLQYAPTYKSETERTTSTDYAQSLMVGLSANFLPVDWAPAAYKGNLSGFYDPIRRYWTTVPIAFEAYTMDLCNPLMLYWALYGGLDKHVDYLRTDPTLVANWDGSLKPTASLLQWARDYVGKSAQNTPKVWTVMREHMNPTLRNCRGSGYYYFGAGTKDIWPQLGNFNFFLTQVDNVPGGRTVPETNNKGADRRYAVDPQSPSVKATEAGLGNCPSGNTYFRTDMYGETYPCYPEPYNKDLPPIVGQDSTLYNIKDWTGVGKEGFVVRRTDQTADPKTTNPYMFFKIDDDYMKGDGAKFYKAAITVKYFDMGTDKFSVKYDAVSGEKTAGTVTKTGSKQLKTITFVVEDAKFANRLAGNTDFYLDSRDPATSTNDGNEWVHMVEVERLDQGSEPPTVTPTPTVTLTPSVTPSPTPSTGIVSGTAFDDTNSNGAFDAGETGVAGAEIILENYATKQESYKVLSQADGSFQFTGVVPDQYTLKEKTAPTGYSQSLFSITFPVQANVTLSGFNFPHRAMATATPTVTPTVTPSATPTKGNFKVYLPTMIR